MAAVIALGVMFVLLVMVVTFLDLTIGFLTKQPSPRKRLNLYRALLRHLVTTRHHRGGAYFIDPGEDWTCIQIIRYPRDE